MRNKVEKLGMTNRSERNALHLAALFANIETIDMLAAGNLFGLDPDARDKNGHTPNECFLKCRSAHCAVARKSFDVEKGAWARLMDSARRQNKASLDVAGNETRPTRRDPLTSKGIRNKNEDWSSLSEISSDNRSEEIYVDAEEGND